MAKASTAQVKLFFALCREAGLTSDNAKDKKQS